MIAGLALVALALSASFFFFISSNAALLSSSPNKSSHSSTSSFLGAALGSSFFLGASFLAATAGTTSLGELLIAQGAVIDQLDLKEGYSALMMAAISGHVDFARMLIAQGADVNLTTEWNVSAVTMALRGGNEELQRVLREAGAAEPKPVPLPVMFPYGWVGDPILVQQLQRIQRN